MPFRPLFVTRFSLSNRTAIGVLTQRFVSGIQGAMHLYWEDLELGGRPAHSLRFERPILSRQSIFKREGIALSIARALRLPLWHGNVLTHAGRKRLRRIAGQVSVVYVAPIDGADATRMRHLIELLDRPFIVHIWDLLDGLPSPGDDLDWLLTYAREVFCLTDEMRGALDLSRAGLLAFGRADAARRSAPPGKGTGIRIGLIGNIGSYRSGLAGIGEADEILKSNGIAVEWRYLGSNAVARKLPSGYRDLLSVTGFISSNAERDRLLAECHFALQPGPREEPEKDTRSAFSVPSRLMDFAALGLPVVGFVHPRSATANFAPELRGTMCLQDGAALAAVIGEMQSERAWWMAARASRRFFERIDATNPVRVLATALRRHSLPPGNSESEIDV